MGGIGVLLSFERVELDGAKFSEVKLDSGGGPNITCEHFSSSGDDSSPLKDDIVVYVDIQRSGGAGVVGCIDTKNESKTGPGEKRIYARDSGGTSVVEFWLKSDGSAVLQNQNGVIQLATNGDITLQGASIIITGESINLNGAVISASGEIQTAGGIDLDTHTHMQPNDSFGNVEQETLPPS